MCQECTIQSHMFSLQPESVNTNHNSQVRFLCNLREKLFFKTKKKKEKYKHHTV